MGIQRIKVVVIGAGQAGLAVGYSLKEQGLAPGEDFVILDRAPAAGGAWQFRWEGMRLGAAHRVNDLPGMGYTGLSFATAPKDQPACQVVTEYYSQYEQTHQLPILRPVTVKSVSSFHTDLVVETTADTYLAQIIINASGTWGAPFVPYYAGRYEFRAQQLHTVDYRNPQQFAGQRVAVVGGGNSAVSILLELERTAAQLVWVTRRPAVFRHPLDLPDPEAVVLNRDEQEQAARAGYALPSIARGSGITLTRKIQSGVERGLLKPRSMFSRMRNNFLVWEDGESQAVDAVIWATGFRPELRHLAPLRLRETAGGYQIDDGQAGRDCRIFLVGYGSSASTSGANRVGRMVAKKVAAFF